MLSEQELIAYLENALPPAERTRVEAELERDNVLRRQLVAQAGMDRVLRAALGGREVIKQKVLEETAFIPRARRRDSAAPSGLSAMLDWLFTTLRQPAAIGVVAVCVLLVGVGLWLRSSPGGSTGLRARSRPRRRLGAASRAGR